MGCIARLAVIFEAPTFSQKAVVPREIQYSNFAVFAPSIQAETNYNFRPDGERENGKIKVFNSTGNYSFL